MPDRTLSILGVIASSLAACYVVLMITTVTFATWQTELSLAAREAETAISMLESRYYDEVGTLAATDPSSMSLGKPRAVRYAVQAAAPALSLR